jgi:protein-tyrosine-phosphatase
MAGRPRKLLFVCAGNVCRSVMAQYLAERLARERGLAWRARSCGVTPAAPGTATPAEVWKALGAAPGSWTAPAPAAPTEEAMAWADLVLTMTGLQRDFVAGAFPEHRGKVAVLRPYAGLGPPADIPDPGGQPEEEFRVCARQIREALDALARSLS